MKAFIEHNYIEARRAALAEIAWMNQQNLGFADRSGGVDYLRANTALDSAKRFLGIENRLIKLAAFDDAAEAYIQALSEIVEDQFSTIQKLNFELKQARQIEPAAPVDRIDFREYLQLMLLGTRPRPRKIGALIDYWEGRRRAAFDYATTTQPHLF